MVVVVVAAGSMFLCVADDQSLTLKQADDETLAGQSSQELARR